MSQLKIHSLTLKSLQDTKVQHLLETITTKFNLQVIKGPFQMPQDLVADTDKV